jgi:hypothetical protein
MLNKEIATPEFNHTLNCSMIAFRTPNYQGMRTDDGGTRNEEPKHKSDEASGKRNEDQVSDDNM